MRASVWGLWDESQTRKEWLLNNNHRKRDHVFTQPRQPLFVQRCSLHLKSSSCHECSIWLKPPKPDEPGVVGHLVPSCNTCNNRAVQQVWFLCYFTVTPNPTGEISGTSSNHWQFAGLPSWLKWECPCGERSLRQTYSLVRWAETHASPGLTLGHF